MKRFKLYRRLLGGTWYNVQFTEQAGWICSTWVGVSCWSRTYSISKYFKLIKTETYDNKFKRHRS